MPKNTYLTPLRTLSANAGHIVHHLHRLLEQSRATTRMRPDEHFQHALDIWHAALDGMEMEPWLQRCQGLEKGLAPLAKAFGLLVYQALQGYEDLLGNLYMTMQILDIQRGQCFTPPAVARLMAHLTMGEIQLPIRFIEPACGSGVMILATAEALEEVYPGSTTSGQAIFYAVDIDPICVSMCHLNMRLHGLHGKVVQGNTLTQTTTQLFTHAPWIRPLMRADQQSTVASSSASQNTPFSPVEEKSPEQPLTDLWGNPLSPSHPNTRSRRNHR